MTAYLLDTDICSYVIRRRPETLAKRFEEHAAALSVSVITAAELRFGYAKISSKSVEGLVEGLLERVTVLSWTDAETWHYAKIRTALEKKGTPIGAMDLLIATHALSRGCTLVSNNLKHFSKVPQLRVEVWT